MPGNMNVVGLQMCRAVFLVRSFAMEDQEISKVPYDPTIKVDTFWDLGIGDSTAIWFTQSIGRAICYRC